MQRMPRGRAKRYIGIAALALVALAAWQVLAAGGDKTGFPEGYDAVQAAPARHRVINSGRPGELPLLRVEIKVGK